MTDKPLTERERLFVAAWCGPAKGSNVEAARAAGYSGTPKVLGITAARLLARASVKGAIAAFREESAAADVATAREVQAFMTSVLRGEVEETIVTVNKHGEFVENTAPPRIKDRIKAGEVVAKVCGYEAPTKTELSGTVGVVALTPEQDEALAEWLRLREDPVISARIAELEGA